MLELKGVSKAFGGLMAVRGLSLDVPGGKIVAVIGPNGAGKTTLFHLITGLLPLSGGEVWFKGQRVDRLPAHRIAAMGISRTFQDMALFTNMSVLENVMTGCYMRSKAGFLSTGLGLPSARSEEDCIREWAMQKLELVGLSDRASEKPSSLPLGRQKLLGLARALATEPALLLLDEPAGGLSSTEAAELGRWILKARSDGTTILLVEHRMELVMTIADRVVVVNLGEKIAEGTPAEVQANKAVIAAYLGEELAK